MDGSFQQSLNVQFPLAFPVAAACIWNGLSQHVSPALSLSVTSRCFSSDAAFLDCTYLFCYA